MLLYPRSLRRRGNRVHAFWMPLAPSMSMLSSSSDNYGVKKKRIEKLESRLQSCSHFCFCCLLFLLHLQHRHDFYIFANLVYRDTFASYLEPNLAGIRDPSDGSSPHNWHARRRSIADAVVRNPVAAAQAACA